MVGRGLIQRGDVWLADLDVGSHYVVPVTRQEAIPLLTSITCVFITSMIRGHPAEVPLGLGEGLRHESAANCDYLLSVEMSQFTRRVGRLSVAKLFELDAALKVALGLT